MNIMAPHLRIARFVVEAVSPISVASGRASIRFDTSIVRDANGLPTIPGTSLAGVLRHLYAQAGGDDRALFGHARTGAGEAGEDRPSRVHLSWGCVLDSRARAVEGLLLDPERLQDPLLGFLAEESPVTRQRVRINHRGASDAEKRGLFDRSAVPRGTRFAFEILVQDEDPGQLDEDWRRLRGLFAHPALRLGGATRAGLGEVRCVAWHEAGFDLTRPEDWKRFAALDPAVDAVSGLQRVELASESPEGWECVRLALEPVGGWRIGGTALTPVSDRSGKLPDDVPHHEAVIEWSEGRARIRERQVVAPASSIKGALAHRVAFHANRLAGRWGKEAPTGSDCPEVAELFGAPAGSEGAHAGRVLISDAWLERTPQTHWQMHNSIDRFTGGARDGVLFGEEVLWRERIELSIWMRKGISDAAGKAWHAALDDLREGRLPLGGGAAKGHGLMREVSDA